MNSADHGLVLMRTRDGEDPRMALQDTVFLHAETACHDHTTVLLHRLTDRFQGLRLCGVEKAAGVNDDQISAVVFARELITLGT